MNATDKGEVSAEYYSRRGIALYREQKPALSLDAFTAMLRFRQPTAEELRFVGLDYVALHDLPSAHKWLHASLELKSNDWRTWRYLGGVQYSEEKASEAAASFRECLKLDPHNALAEDGLARSLSTLGNYDEAGRSFRLAIAFNLEEHLPSFLPPLHYGTFLFNQGNLKDALQQLTFAEKLEPQDSETHEMLSEVYRRLGKAEQAISEMRLASSLCPERARLHFMLAQLYRSAGRYPEEKKEIESYAALAKQHPNDPDR